jgi:type II secretory pathway component PulC
MMRKNIPTTPLVWYFIFSSLFLDTAWAYRQDPFAPLPKINNMVNPESYHLTMILITQDQKSAFINQKQVQEGDKIKKAVVLHIMKDRVILKKAGSVIELSIIK